MFRREYDKEAGTELSQAVPLRSERHAFRGAWLEPSEQRRVRFAVFLCTSEIKAAMLLTLTLLLAKAVLRYGFR